MQPTYNHSRADGPFDPCPICAKVMGIKAAIALALDNEWKHDKKAGTFYVTRGICPAVSQDRCLDALLSNGATFVSDEDLVLTVKLPQ